MSDPEVTRETQPVDNEPSEVDVKVDAALGDLVRCAYHDRWLRARLQIVEDHINTLRCENAQPTRGPSRGLLPHGRHGGIQR